MKLNYSLLKVEEKITFLCEECKLKNEIRKVFLFTSCESEESFTFLIKMLLVADTFLALLKLFKKLFQLGSIMVF